MTTHFWTGPRLFAIGIATFVVILFIAANAHLIKVAFASHPACALQTVTEGGTTYGAATPSC